MLRGQVDKIPQVTQDKQIDIQDVLKPCDSGQSLRVVVDGLSGKNWTGQKLDLGVQLCQKVGPGVKVW